LPNDFAANQQSRVRKLINIATTFLFIKIFLRTIYFKEQLSFANVIYKSINATLKKVVRVEFIILSLSKLTNLIDRCFLVEIKTLTTDSLAFDGYVLFQNNGTKTRTYKSE